MTMTMTMTMTIQQSQLHDNILMILLTCLCYIQAYARIAPVQMTFFGHPTTSGLPTMDYFLTSEFIEPPAAHEGYE